MKSSILKFVLILSILNSSNQKPLTDGSCLNYVQKLSFNDKCLASRLDVKLATAKSTQDTVQFFNSIKNNLSKCNGTAFSCGKIKFFLHSI